ncbi:succinylarginine dihydrolase [Veillonella nakazawae]|jgi:putative N-succinylarginine dihydrolase|uniref:Succinylarginine dihydrolase n=1 Tax=Veillonella nakazawae TaxID=2682456 RepID=A0AB35HEB7_9FIRM|nr:succinylarginine dihydrolase [Veillonella nakazawae]MCB8606175.1 succinylarginine dihydrolase [Veillonella nakazawae]
MVRVLYLFLLLVVFSPINAFADYQRDTFDIQRSLNEQIHSQLKVPAEVLRTKNDKDYSFTLMIRTDSQGRITSVELDSNENISNDEIYSKLVQSAKDTVWNIGYIDVKEDLVIYVPFHFIISSKDDVN